MEELVRNETRRLAAFLRRNLLSLEGQSRGFVAGYARAVADFSTETTFEVAHDYVWTSGSEPECRHCGFYGPDNDDGSLVCPGPYDFRYERDSLVRKTEI